MPRRKTQEEFIADVRRVHGDRYDYSQVEYKISIVHVTIVCAVHGPFRIRPDHHKNRKQGCPKCYVPKSWNKSNTDEFIRRAKGVHGDCYDYSLVNYTHNKNHVSIICKEHGVFEQTPDGHINQRQGCPRCNTGAPGWNKSNTAAFVKAAKKVHGDRYDYSHVVYKDSLRPVIIICREHGEFEQAPKSHKRGAGCLFCAGNTPYTTDLFIQRAKEIHGNRYDYSQVQYRKIEENVTIICKKHGPFEQTPSSHIHQTAGCVKCFVSKGEAKVETFLRKVGIGFESQKKFPECRGKRYPLAFDFYIPSLKLLVEYDGQQHFAPAKGFGGEQSFKKVIANDRIKNHFAASNGYRLLRIPYTDFDRIEDVLTEALNPDAGLNKGEQLTLFS